VNAKRFLIGITALTTAACNMITGADSIEFSDEGTGGATTSGVTTGAQGPATSGAGGASGSGDVGTGTGPTTSGAGPSTGSGAAADLVPADGVSITAIKLYQGVERPLMSGGSDASSSVPIVGGRDAMLRIFYSAQSQKSVTVRVTLGSAQPILVQANVSGNSTQGSLASTINVTIPGATLTGAANYKVELLVPNGQASGSNTAASYPAQGAASLPVQSAGQTLKLVLVPIQYAADGSNRLPDTSQSQLNLYRDYLYKMYPIPSVTVTVRPTVKWSQQVAANGSGWDALLNQIANLRQQSGAKPDEYWYGVFSAAPTFGQFCSGGCVAGLSMIAGPNDAYARAGIGVGFSGPDSASAAAHEIGHQHGRPHAPCGVNQGVDSSYPYSGGKIGAWGYDLTTKQLVDPSRTDFMSYCHPDWISDYNYKLLFNRLKLINGAEWIQGPAAKFERITVSDEGGGTWLEPVELTSTPGGEPTEVVVETPNGPEKRTGWFYPYTHIPGGVLLVPAGLTRANGVQAKLRAGTLDIAR
jgi:hypothetical protein